MIFEKNKKIDREKIKSSRKITRVLMSFLPPAPVTWNPTDIYDVLFRTISSYAFGARNIKQHLKNLKFKGTNSRTGNALVKQALRRYMFIKDDPEFAEEKLALESIAKGDVNRLSKDSVTFFYFRIVTPWPLR